MGGFRDRHKDLHVLVIDTDQYSGSFEREMVAFMTGQIGDCGVGDEEAATFVKEHPDMDLEDVVSSQVDEIGCWRPATIWPSPGDDPDYNSVACFLNKLPPEPQLLFLVDRAKKYCDQRRDRAGGTLGFLGARLVLHKTVDEDIAVF